MSIRTTDGEAEDILTLHLSGKPIEMERSQYWDSTKIHNDPSRKICNDLIAVQERANDKAGKRQALWNARMRFEQLDVWKRAARLAADLYRALADTREYAFKDQITRSALSIASNIAEGYERTGEKDRAKFLTYAKGSSGELRTQLYIGIEAGIIPRQQGWEWIRETEELSKMLHGLIKTLTNNR